MGKEILETIEFWTKREQNLIKYLENKLKEIQPLMNKSSKGLWEYHLLKGQKIAYKDILEKVKSGEYE